MALSMEVAGLTYFLVATCLFTVISNVTANFDPYMKITIDRQKPVFTSERLSQFDGSDVSRTNFRPKLATNLLSYFIFHFIFSV